MRYKDEEPGQIEVLGDRYLLQSRIGRGGMATIYRVRDLQMDRVVAVKVLREVYNTDPKFVARFQREARAASAIPVVCRQRIFPQTRACWILGKRIILFPIFLISCSIR